MRLDTFFALERPAETPDGGGGQLRSWEVVGRLWGALTPSTGRETALGDRPSARVTHRITFRRAKEPDARPKPEQRLVSRGRVFAIRAVADAGPPGKYLTVFAEEGPFS